MSTNRSRLRVESFEDRVMPATVGSIPYFAPSYGASYIVDDSVGVLVRPGSVLTIRHMGTGETFRVASGQDYPVFVRLISWGGDWNMSVRVVPTNSAGNTSEPPRAFTSPMSSQGGSQPTTTAPRNQVAENIGQQQLSQPAANVSIPVGISANNSAVAGSQVAEAAVHAAIYASPQTQPVAVTTRIETRDWTTPAPIYLEGVELDSAATPVPNQSGEPPVVEAPPVVVPETSGNPSEPAIPVSLEPLTGLLPFDLNDVEVGVRTILHQVSELDRALSDDSSSVQDYLWMGAAALVAGGVVQAAWARRARPTDPRILGLDSVLVRWGERHGA